MTIKEILAELKKYTRTTKILGYIDFCSYRGSYESLAVSYNPLFLTLTVEQYIALLEQYALDKPFKGYKGNTYYTMESNVDVYLADWGMVGELITGVELKLVKRLASEVNQKPELLLLNEEVLVFKTE
jgi:hypothetical protein